MTRRSILTLFGMAPALSAITHERFSLVYSRKGTLMNLVYDREQQRILTAMEFRSIRKIL